VQIFGKNSKSKTSKKSADNENSAPEYVYSQTDAPDNANVRRSANDAPEEKTEAEIQAEIQSIFRQITASVTFLPMLDGNCTFNVLVYADADSEVPMEWGDSDAKEIQNGEKVQLRSFSTSNHRVDTLVSYRQVESSMLTMHCADCHVGLQIRGGPCTFLFSHSSESGTLSQQIFRLVNPSQSRNNQYIFLPTSYTAISCCADGSGAPPFLSEPPYPLLPSFKPPQ
jgi:hypothetical protein